MSSCSSTPEPQRAREVQRYLQSWQIAQGSSLTVAQNVGSIEAPSEQVAHFTPKVSSDKTLSAFSQLAVLRLNVKRAMVSLIDSTAQTILTEATKGLNLGSTTNASGGELWLGTAVLARPDAVCEHCLNNTYTARDPDGRSYTAPGLVVPDCRLDARFETRPYVVSEPGVRFYAGVPIMSRNGHKIGAYAVSDEQPREGLSIDEFQFMEGVAKAVMEHLEWARDRVDRFKGERIVRGLAAFIEGSSTGDGDTPATKEDGAFRPPEISLTAARDPASGRVTRSQLPRTPIAELPPPLQQKPPQGDKQKSDGMTDMFQRAAEILRTSALADGVAFFGATATSGNRKSVRSLNAGLLNASDSDNENLQATSGSEGVGMDSSDSDTSPAARPCKILAYSIADDRARLEVQEGPALSLGTLEKYFSLFPKGKSLSFTDEGAGISSEDDSASDRESTRSAKGRKIRMDHKELLKKIPGAKAVIFIPLYDYTEDRLAGGCFLWTSVTGRLMNLDEDLSYLRAFSNSIMSQVARINTQKNEAAKTTFIASMSHELRSPLHGILGASEFFRDTPLNPYQAGLIASITSCGKTLLDTLNHVLDYSKINRLGRMQLRRSAKQNKLLKLSTDSLDSLNITTVVDLAVLIEEVVDATSAGHSFKVVPEGVSPDYPGLPTTKTDDSVSVLLNISPRSSWMVRTQAGAIRRIIMNLFGNALKNTTEGSVRVSLSGQESPNGAKVDVLLKVTDTGKGMSEEFLRNRLFVPFSQEDSFQPGTGLGLSIVKQIVDSLGGSVEVSSLQGKGTEVSVRIRLAPVADDLTTKADDSLDVVVERTRGKQLVLLEANSNSAQTQERARHLNDVLTQTCAKWFDMKVVKEGETDGSDADLYLYSEPPSVTALENRFGSLQVAARKLRKVPIILVCLNARDAVHVSQTQTRTLVGMGQVAEVIPQPCGPRKLAKVFNQCFQMTEAMKSTSGLDTTRADAITPPRPPLRPTQEEEILGEEKAKISEPSESSETSKAPTALNSASALFGLPSPPPLNPGTPSLVQEVQPQPSREPPPTTPAPTGGLHVLLVDDNKINLQLLVMFMKKCGFTYTEAENGQEALDRYTEACIPASQTTGPGRQRFDFVLMDISMPVMDGIEATKRIREFERVNAIPAATIIALTGLASADAQKHAQSAGVDVFMPKPVRFAELRRLLRASGKES